MREVELDMLKRHLYNSKYCVCLLGKGLDYESGIVNIRDDDDSYDIEENYGHSFEEIFSYPFLNTRPEEVFRVYKDKIIQQLEKEPGDSYKALQQLEERGLIKYMITRSAYGMAKKAGCNNVIEMKGNYYKLICSKCGQKVNIDEIDLSGKKIPNCKYCSSLLRPATTLFGEMVSIDLITRATEEVSKADLLIVIGAGLVSTLCDHMVKYFSGDNLVLIHQNKEVADAKAELVIYETPAKVLPRLL